MDVLIALTPARPRLTLARMADEDFSFLGQLSPAGRTFELALPEIGWTPAPVLILKYLGPENTAFRAAQLEHNLARPPLLDGLQEPPKGAPEAQHRRWAAEVAERTTQAQRESYAACAQHWLIGWRFVRNGKGEYAQWSPLNAERFLRALPRHLQTKVMNAAADVDNFVGKLSQTEITPAAVQALLGNDDNPGNSSSGSAGI